MERFNEAIIMKTFNNILYKQYGTQISSVLPVQQIPTEERENEFVKNENEVTER